MSSSTSSSLPSPASIGHSNAKDDNDDDDDVSKEENKILTADEGGCGGEENANDDDDDDAEEEEIQQQQQARKLQQQQRQQEEGVLDDGDDDNEKESDNKEDTPTSLLLSSPSSWGGGGPRYSSVSGGLITTAAIPHQWLELEKRSQQQHDQQQQQHDENCAKKEDIDNDAVVVHHNHHREREEDEMKMEEVDQEKGQEEYAAADAVAEEAEDHHGYSCCNDNEEEVEVVGNYNNNNHNDTNGDVYNNDKPGAASLPLPPPAPPDCTNGVQPQQYEDDSNDVDNEEVAAVEQHLGKEVVAKTDNINNKDISPSSSSSDATTRRTDVVEQEHHHSSLSVNGATTTIEQRAQQLDYNIRQCDNNSNDDDNDDKNVPEQQQKHGAGRKKTQEEEGKENAEEGDQDPTHNDVQELEEVQDVQEEDEQKKETKVSVGLVVVPVEERQQPHHDEIPVIVELQQQQQQHHREEEEEEQTAVVTLPTMMTVDNDGGDCNVNYDEKDNHLDLPRHEQDEDKKTKEEKEEEQNQDQTREEEFLEEEQEDEQDQIHYEEEEVADTKLHEEQKKIEVAVELGVVCPGEKQQELQYTQKYHEDVNDAHARDGLEEQQHQQPKEEEVEEAAVMVPFLNVDNNVSGGNNNSNDDVDNDQVDDTDTGTDNKDDVVEKQQVPKGDNINIDDNGEVYPPLEGSSFPNDSSSAKEEEDSPKPGVTPSSSSSSSQIQQQQQNKNEVEENEEEQKGKEDPDEQHTDEEDKEEQCEDTVVAATTTTSHHDAVDDHDKIDAVTAAMTITAADTKLISAVAEDEKEELEQERTHEEGVVDAEQEQEQDPTRHEEEQENDEASPQEDQTKDVETTEVAVVGAVYAEEQLQQQQHPNHDDNYDDSDDAQVRNGLEQLHYKEEEEEETTVTVPSLNVGGGNNNDDHEESNEVGGKNTDKDDVEEQQQLMHSQLAQLTEGDSNVDENDNADPSQGSSCPPCLSNSVSRSSAGEGDSPQPCITYVSSSPQEQQRQDENKGEDVHEEEHKGKDQDERHTDEEDKAQEYVDSVVAATTSSQQDAVLDDDKHGAPAAMTTTADDRKLVSDVAEDEKQEQEQSHEEQEVDGTKLQKEQKEGMETEVAVELGIFCSEEQQQHDDGNNDDALVRNGLEQQQHEGEKGREAAVAVSIVSNADNNVSVGNNNNDDDEEESNHHEVDGTDKDHVEKQQLQLRSPLLEAEGDDMEFNVDPPEGTRPSCSHNASGDSVAEEEEENDSPKPGITCVSSSSSSSSSSSQEQAAQQQKQDGEVGEPEEHYDKHDKEDEEKMYEHAVTTLQQNAVADNNNAAAVALELVSTAAETEQQQQYEQEEPPHHDSLSSSPASVAAVPASQTVETTSGDEILQEPKREKMSSAAAMSVSVTLIAAGSATSSVEESSQEQHLTNGIQQNGCDSISLEELVSREDGNEREKEKEKPFFDAAAAEVVPQNDDDARKGFVVHRPEEAKKRFVVDHGRNNDANSSNDHDDGDKESIEKQRAQQPPMFSEHEDPVGDGASCRRLEQEDSEQFSSSPPSRATGRTTDCYTDGVPVVAAGADHHNGHAASEAVLLDEETFDYARVITSQIQVQRGCNHDEEDGPAACASAPPTTAVPAAAIATTTTTTPTSPSVVLPSKLRTPRASPASPILMTTTSPTMLKAPPTSPRMPPVPLTSPPITPTSRSPQQQQQQKTDAAANAASPTTTNSDKTVPPSFSLSTTGISSVSLITTLSAVDEGKQHQLQQQQPPPEVEHYNSTSERNIHNNEMMASAQTSTATTDATESKASAEVTATSTEFVVVAADEQFGKLHGIGQEPQLQQEQGDDDPQHPPHVRSRQAPVQSQSSLPRSRPPNALQQASIVSRALFLWPSHLLAKGMHRPLVESDLYELLPQDSSEYSKRYFLKLWHDELKNNPEHPSLHRAIIKDYFKSLWFVQIFMSMAYAARVVQAVVLGQLIRYFEGDGSNGLFHATLLVLCASIILFEHHHVFLLTWRKGMQLRISSIAAIYDKSLRLSSTNSDTIAGYGQIMNLVSNDVERYLIASLFMNFLIWAPIQSVAILIVGTMRLGWAFAVGFVILITFFVPLQFYLSQRFAQLRSQIAGLTDQRVTFVSQAIRGVRIMKMYGYENKFLSRIQKLRKVEVEQIRMANNLKAYNEAVFFCSNIVVGLIMFTVHVYVLNKELHTGDVFTVFTLINILQLEMTKHVSIGVMGISEVYVSIQRIQSFLLHPELPPSSRTSSEGEASSSRQGRQESTTGTAACLDDKGASSAPASLALSSFDSSADLHGKDDDDEMMTSVAAAAVAVASRKQRSKQQPIAISMSNVKCYWNQVHHVLQKRPSSSSTLQQEDGQHEQQQQSLIMAIDDVTIDFAMGTLTAIIGPVGCGKSALLQAIVKELPVASGSIRRRYDTLSYACQDPWIMDGTVRENIIMGTTTTSTTFDDEWYHTVIQACGLHVDLKRFVDGDLTVVGDRGVQCSGGQRARIGLARALYRDSDVLVMDDPLSAVDSKVGKLLYRDAILDLAVRRGKCVILATHQHQYIHDRRCVLVMNGTVVCAGSYPYCVSASGGKLTPPNNSNNHLDKSSTTMAAPAAAASDPETLSVSTVEDDAATFITEVTDKAGNLRQLPTEVKENHNGEGEEGQGEEDCEGKPRREYGDDINYEEKNENRNAGDITNDDNRETNVQGMVRLDTYIKYLQSMGGVWAGMFLLVLFTVTQSSVLVTVYVVGIWAEMPYDRQRNDMKILRWIVGLTIIVMTLSLFRAKICFRWTVEASKRLHDRMTKSVLRSKIAFFDTNPLGRILNRFSADVGSNDDLLPHTLFDFGMIAFIVFGVIITTIISMPFTLIAIPPLLWYFWSVRNIFVTTTRELKRLEGMARSPMFAMLGESLGGIATIRSNDAIGYFTNKFHVAHDTHTRAFFAFIGASRWIGFRMDSILFLFLATVCYLSVIFHQQGWFDVDPAVLGLSLSFMLQLAGVFQWCIRQSAEVVNQMVSVERVLGYGELPSEPPLALEMDHRLEDLPILNNDIHNSAPIAAAKVDPNHEENGEIQRQQQQQMPHQMVQQRKTGWPNRGAVDFERLSVRYRPSLPLALDRVSFRIPAGSRVGVVGRTGSGKSTLVQALFRLLDAEEGRILIDGVDIASVGLHTLRTKLAVIPQSPTLFSGCSIRDNLDLFNSHTDGELWAVLRDCHLADFITNELPNGWNTLVADNGTNFSVGQRQLLCLARAILNQSPILILDEATASVDKRTDQLLQQTLRQSFHGKTILAVAHRLDTVIDYDLILVLGSGRVLEFGTPAQLLLRSDSQGKPFASLVGDTGEKMAKLLRKRVRDNHNAALLIEGSSGHSKNSDKSVDKWVDGGLAKIEV